MSIVLSQPVEHLHLIQSTLDLGQLILTSMHCIKAHAGIFHETDFIYIYLLNRLTNSNTRHLEKHTFTTFGCDGTASASASCLFTYLLLVFISPRADQTIRASPETQHPKKLQNQLLEIYLKCTWLRADNIWSVQISECCYDLDKTCTVIFLNNNQESIQLVLICAQQNS